MQLLLGDCLELMKDIPDESIDMILCDLPYGTTKNKWDCMIPLEKLWGGYKRIIKRRGAIALFSQCPFDKILGASNLEMLKYEWVWEKAMPTGRLNCHNAPLKVHENILVFSKSAACYVKNPEHAMIYNPQMTTGKPYKSISGSRSPNYDTKWCRREPVPLLEYLIKTYTSEGDLVLDNCMGSGSTGVACVNTGRDFIGMELNADYFNIAVNRIHEAEERKKHE